MHASERSERASLENFVVFTFLNCYFFQYFVGTSDTLSVQNDMLVGLHVPTHFQMYRQKSGKALLGGGGGPLATLMVRRRKHIGETFDRVVHNAV